MIEVEYGIRKMSIKGHALYRKAGEDIVCSAVSAIVYTLVAKLEKEHEKIKFEKKIDSGYAVINISEVDESYENVMDEIFDAVLTGLKLVSKEYPDHVSIKTVKGGLEFKKE